MIPHLRFAGLCLLALAPLAMPGQAWAQTQIGEIPGTSGHLLAPKDKGTRPENLPPGLPGSGTQSSAAERKSGPSDLKPNEALFDAINRGDLAAARDALGRGADLSARNVLGLTPAELSIDLGRNNITFVLLSLRGAPTPNPTATATARAPAATSAKVAAKPADKPSPKPSSRPAPVLAIQATAPPQRFVSGDPGAPVPQAGFLGFGPVGHP